MAETLPFAFLTDCNALRSFLAHPNLTQRLHVISNATHSVRPEPLEFYGDMLTLSRFDNPDMIGFTLPRLGDPGQHYLISARFNNSLIASVLRLVHCSACPEKKHCLPQVRTIELVNKVSGIVLANHHFA